MSWTVGDLAVNLSLNAEGFVDGMKNVKKSTEGAQKAMREGFAAEAMNAAIQRMSGTLSGLGTEFGRVAGAATAMVGQTLQGFMQGGPLGAAIGVTTGLIGTMAEAWNESEKASKAANDSAMTQMQALQTETQKWGDELIAVNDELKDLQKFRQTGGQLGSEFITTQRKAKGATSQRELAEGTLSSNRALFDKYLVEKSAIDERLAKRGPIANALGGSQLDARSNELQGLLNSLGPVLSVQEKAVEAAKAMEQTALAHERLTAAKGLMGPPASAANIPPASPKLAIPPSPKLGEYGIAVARQQYDIAQFHVRVRSEDESGPLYLLNKALTHAAMEERDLSNEAKRSTEALRALERKTQDLANTEQAQQRAAVKEQADKSHEIAKMKQTQKNEIEAAQRAVSIGGIVEQDARGSRVGQFASTVAKGAELGGPVGGFAAALGSLITQTRQYDRIMQFGSKILDELVEVVGLLIEPFVPFAQVLAAIVHAIAAAVKPFFAFNPIMRIFSEGLRFAGAVIAGFAGVIEWLGDKFSWLMAELTAGVLYFLDWVAGDYTAEYEAAAARAATLGNRSLATTVDAALASYWAATDATNAMGDAARNAAGALNAPQFYKVLRAVFNADTGRNVTGAQSGTAQDTQAMVNGSGTRGMVHPGSPSTAGMTPLGAGGVTNVFENCSFTIKGDVDDFLEWLRRHGMQTRGSPA